MNKQKFIEYLHKPGNLTEDSLKELDELISEFPYFQTARALSAKGNRINRTSEAGKRTASAAVYSTNRLLLKKYLTGDIFFLNPVVGTESVPPEEDHFPTQSSVVPTKAPESTPQFTEEVISSQEIKEEPVSASIDIPDLPEKASGTSSIDQIISELQKDMEELAISRAKYLEVTRKIEEEDAVEEAVKKATVQKAQQSKEPESKSESKAPTSPTRKAEKTTKVVTVKETKPKSSTTAKKTVSKTKSTTKKATAGSKKNTKKPKPTKDASSEKKKEPDLKAQRDLIDNFIKINPSFSPKNDKINDVDYSVASSTLHGDFVTEYLAEIFLEQGKNDRAIEIYNSLMLRFPEKKSYFAGLIKKIK